jgi:hypothetical protein
MCVLCVCVRACESHKERDSCVFVCVSARACLCVCACVCACV